MSTSVSWAVRTRRVVLPMVCVASAAAAVAAQFAPSHLIDIRSASTGQLVGVLLLLALPAATLAAMFTERRVRRPQPQVAAVEPTPLIPAPRAPSVTEGVIASPSRAPGVSEGVPPQAATPIPAPSPRQHPPAPRPKISVVIETKPSHQVYTLTASPRGVRAA